jgi:trehalose 6-phosphate phosphatase
MSGAHGGLPAPLVAALERLAQTSRLLVALDFDGTLAPEVDDPEQARALPRAREAVLRLLRMPETDVALVSGRAIQSLERVAELPEGALFVGSHGVELRLDGEDIQSTLSEADTARVVRLGELLDPIADRFDGVWLEHKPAGFAMHVRLATADDGRLAHETALAETAAELPGLTVRRGKNVLEFSVHTATKGEAIDRLRSHTAATAVLYAGDDVTDEDAFAVLGDGDLGLKSGPGDTVANQRVDDPAEVADALTLLADLRQSALDRR